MNIPCISCKGRNPANCGRRFCPIVAKAEAMFRVKDMISGESFSGSSPAPFVGRFGYPEVNVGILAPPEISEDAWLYDAPREWAAAGIKIEDIAKLRGALINSRFKANIKHSSLKARKLLGMSREIGMSSKPVDVDITLDKKPAFNLKTDSQLAPMGPQARIKKAELASTPKVHTKVDKAVSDTDLKAADAVVSLYHSGFDENFLSKLLSVGSLGIGGRRRLVPTRWSITATDDTIAKNLLKDVKQNDFAEHLAFFDGYLGNYYLILVFPEQWSYELFETYLPKASWNPSEELQFCTDYEPFSGRKNYAEACAGGYYTARLAVAEKLAKMKKQATVLALRFITGEYSMPLGVWVTREAARKSLSSKPISFASKELMIAYAKDFIKKKFGCEISPMLKQSILLRELGRQRRLSAFTA